MTSTAKPSQNYLYPRIFSKTLKGVRLYPQNFVKETCPCFASLLTRCKENSMKFNLICSMLAVIVFLSIAPVSAGGEPTTDFDSFMPSTLAEAIDVPGVHFDSEEDGDWDIWASI